MKLILILFIAVLMLALPASAQQTGSCFVTPNPDPVETPYVVTASGLTPSVEYVLHMTEATHSTEQTKLDTILIPDTNGNASYNGDYSGPRGIWTPGTVKAAIAESSGRGFNVKGGKVAACSFTVA